MRKNHSPKQIIGETSIGVLISSNLRDNTCLIVDFKPRIVKATLENEDHINSMNEEID